MDISIPNSRFVSIPKISSVSAPAADFLAATWQYHELWAWQVVNFGDASTQRGGGVMRRKLRGKTWQYRSLHDEW